jgi:hypothetical protein
MEAATTTQLITVAATLSGVLLTLFANAYNERRRARDLRELESLRLGSEHAKWLRDERVDAYSGLSTAGEEVLQFIRTELPALAEPDHADRRDIVEARWRELRTDLRKAYNQVALFGADEARATGQELWRTARNTANDFFRDLGTVRPSAEPAGVTEEIRSAASRMGIAGERFLEACRKDLQDT